VNACESFEVSFTDYSEHLDKSQVTQAQSTDYSECLYWNSAVSDQTESSTLDSAMGYPGYSAQRKK